MQQNDLISRKALMEEIGAIECSQSCDFCVATNCRIGQIVKTAPEVEAAPVVHGRWEDEYRDAFANPRFRCSICKENALYRIGRDFLGTWNNVQALTPRCPFCGAKMDGERSEG